MNVTMVMIVYSRQYTQKTCTKSINEGKPVTKITVTDLNYKENGIINFDESLTK